MRTKGANIILLVLLISLLCACTPKETEGPTTVGDRTLAYASAEKDIPVFCQFFDWFEEVTWVESEFVDPLLWSEVGIMSDDRSSQKFYQKQFAYMKELGINALAWEFYPRRGVGATYPSPKAIAALKEQEMQIAPFFDVEIAIKAKTQKPEEMEATLSSSGRIRPDMDTVDFMLTCLKAFYDNVPPELLAEDAKGRKVIFVYGYDFDDSEPDEEAYQRFGEALLSGIHALYGEQDSAPVLYWTSKNSTFQEYLFQHFKDSIVPFQFVLDTPQSQYSHDSVTWNFGYDNLGVASRDGLLRVIRNDKQYIEEMGWLAGACDPSLIFIYGWNEPFEGSMLLPSEHDKSTYFRDDLNDIALYETSNCENVYARLRRKSYPIVVSNGDDVFVNAYNGDEAILKTAFERFYGFEMTTSILYGEGFSSQRLEIEPNGKITQNVLAEYSVNGRWELPEDIVWRCEVDGVDGSYLDAIFGN